MPNTFFMMQLNYNSASALRIFLEKEGLGMRKKFGQNFLINPNTRQSLADALGANSGDEVWEVGPGLGAMTALLLERELRVKAFEIDAGFIRILKRLFADEKNLSIVEGDFLKTWSSQKAAPYLLGNLPYNVAAALVADLIEKGCLFSRMVVTVQKEVALRMAARVGSPDYSSFSVLCASVYKVKPLALIRPSAFFPQPNVDSMGVLLEKRQPSTSDHQLLVPAVFYKLVRILFSSRRKTIKNNLTAVAVSQLVKLPQGVSVQDFCAELFQENGLTGKERAEELELEVFLSLAKSIENMRL